MFNFIKTALKKVRETITNKAHGLFAKSTVDKQTLKDLEKILITADTGIKTTKRIIENLESKVKNGVIETGTDLKDALATILVQELDGKTLSPDPQSVFVLVGINGSGKTTFAGKLANRLSTQQNCKVLMAAADTFRAAAPEQLTAWAKKSGAEIIIGKQNQDPTSVAFEGCERYLEGDLDTLIIDTAGRVQTNTNLIKELSKTKRIVNKKMGGHKVYTLLTIDGMLGQNSFQQAKVFNDEIGIDGIVLTKMDGTGKGGIVFAIAQELNIPIAYITFGEGMDQLEEFDAKTYVEGLLG